MKTQIILAAAGTGERLGMQIAKPFVPVKEKPLVSYSLAVFEDCSSVDSVIIAVQSDAINVMKAIVSEAGLKKVKHIIAGGDIRAKSVKNALAVLDEDTDLVLIHDGARPLITVDFVEKMIRAAVDEDALIAAVPVKPTVKQVNPETLTVEKTLDRSCLWDIQTPQIFKSHVLKQAYVPDDINVTDDAALVERLGRSVKVFPGLEQNIKVTIPLDLILVEKLLDF